MAENVISREWKERYSKLPPSIQKEIDELRNKRAMTDELIPIKRTRKPIQTGDVFVIQPKQGLYLYGRC